MKCLLLLGYIISMTYAFWNFYNLGLEILEFQF